MRKSQGPELKEREKGHGVCFALTLPLLACDQGIFLLWYERGEL